MEHHVYLLLKSSCFEIFADEKYGLSSSQKFGRDIIFIDYWKVLFRTLHRWEIRSFFEQNVHRKMIFTNYWIAPVLNFSKIGNMVFFEPKSWWKDEIYRLLKSSCFELFGDRKYALFFSQKVDGKIIFTCYHCFYILYFSAFSGFSIFSFIIIFS